MPCGKRPTVKKWDKPRNIRVITPSKYETTEAAVKVHWKKVVRELEDSYKDEQFWESQAGTVQKLVGPEIFKRIAKIFDLPIECTPYEARSETSMVMDSEQFYSTAPAVSKPVVSRPTTSILSILDYEQTEEEHRPAEEWEDWTSSDSIESVTTKTKSMIKSKSFTSGKLMSKVMSQKVITGSHGRLKSADMEEELADSLDDLQVHLSNPAIKASLKVGRKKNPHYDLLYCNDSETDMIKWDSNYKKKVFEVSASDEFSKKAEILAKKISHDFFQWWSALGNVEFKSEIKRPADIEDLFQVWFDEHASRSLVLDSKVLPCVLQSIANYVGAPQTSCPNVLKRQIAFDIHAETSPEHKLAFGACLPQKMKHIPPMNNTAAMWHSVVIPEDLRTMSCVWEDITHLTSTKAFQKWLLDNPHLPMPPCLKSLNMPGDKKALFVIPSDFIAREGSVAASAQELALPISQFQLEIKEVLDTLMDH